MHPQNFSCIWMAHVNAPFGELARFLVKQALPYDGIGNGRHQHFGSWTAKTRSLVVQVEDACNDDGFLVLIIILLSTSRNPKGHFEARQGTAV